MANSKLDLVVAGTPDAVMMVESEAQELSEDVMLGAVMFGHSEMQHAIDAIIRLAEKAAKDPRPVPEDVHAPVRATLKAAAIRRTGQGVPDRRSSSSAATRIAAVQEEVRRRISSAKAKARLPPMSIPA